MSIHHIGTFPQLEDQMCAFTTDFDRARAGYSPDRLDALVWGLTELLVEPMPQWGCGRLPMNATLLRLRLLILV